MKAMKAMQQPEAATPETKSPKSKPPSRTERREQLCSFAMLVTNNSPLALAHYLNHPWIATEKLPKDKGRAWNPEYGGGWALHMACAYRCETLVDFMLQNGAPVNAVDHTGRNAIMYATDPDPDPKREPTATVNVLLRHGCRTDIVDNDGYGVLYQRQADLPAPLFRRLIDAGARVNCYDDTGAHLLADFISSIGVDHVRKANSLALMEARTGLDIDGCQGMGRGSDNALRAALRSQHLDLAERLVELGADVRRLNNRGDNLLHLPWSPEMVDWLLERAPDMLDNPNYQGATPVLALAHRIHTNPRVPQFLKMLTQLVNAGADLDHVGHYGDGTASARVLLERTPEPPVKEVWSSLVAREVARAALDEMDVSCGKAGP